MKNYVEALSIIDAKSVYDAVIRNGFSFKQDRRKAIDLAMARETLQQVQATIRWCPHTKMLADTLTTVEVSKGNDAMTSVLRLGAYRLAPETEEMQLRKDDPHRKQRDRRTSAAFMREAQGVVKEKLEVVKEKLEAARSASENCDFDALSCCFKCFQ